ncbi:MAG: hypothetical protein LAO79_26140 [Acidobacteriia bacterium]|nr:hypothetical protein [Terriglobia bacterium]
MLLIVTLMTTSCRLRTPDLWVIPDGYEGWVKIDYIVRNAPPLPLQNGHRIIQVSLSGYVQTSSELQEGWASDQFQYANGTPLHSTSWGEGGKVWGGMFESEIVCTETTKTSSSCRSTGRSINQCYFIGTEEQLKTAGQCASRKWPSVSDDDRVALVTK